MRRSVGRGGRCGCAWEGCNGTKHGILRGFDAGSHTATVEIDGSIATYLGGIPVARNIDAAELTTGRDVAVLFIDPLNPQSAVLFAVWEL
jgi:hypothetical protein